MSFIGKAEEKLIKKINGENYRLFLLEQEDRYWLALVIYSSNGLISIYKEVNIDKSEAYHSPCEFILNNINSHASIDHKI